jgi:hypothetical protein
MAVANRGESRSFPRAQAISFASRRRARCIGIGGIGNACATAELENGCGGVGFEPTTFRYEPYGLL